MGEIADMMYDQMMDDSFYENDYDYDDPEDYIVPKRRRSPPPAKADEFEVNE